jgi:hypothetical protein
MILIVLFIIVLFWDSVVNFSVLSRQRHLDLEDVLHVNDQAT